MAGIFTRPTFDDVYSNEFIKQQVNPGSYQIDPIYSESNNKCTSRFGPRQNSRLANSEIATGDIGYRKDIENYLLNLDLPLSRNMTLNSLDDKNTKLRQINEKQNFQVNYCNDYLDQQYTRLDLNGSVLDLRSVNINRFDYPLIDPQRTVYYGFENTDQMYNSRQGVNSRLQAKDSYRK